jgi:hypothetical protein
MKDQHKKITGYRDLDHKEIYLMNSIKAKGAELLLLQAEVFAMLDEQENIKLENWNAATHDADDDDAIIEYKRFAAAEPLRWAEIAKTDIQTGIMALIRAVAQPAV